MSVFNLKRGDTLPILTVTLRNPDGTVHDLTGSTAWKLKIQTSSSGAYVERDMTKVGLDTAGTLRYVWLADDWDEESGNPLGSLPTPPANYPVLECPMEYEVQAGPTATLTFPNNSFDTLRILGDVA